MAVHLLDIMMTTTTGTTTTGSTDNQIERSHNDDTKRDSERIPILAKMSFDSNQFKSFQEYYDQYSLIKDQEESIEIFSRLAHASFLLRNHYNTRSNYHKSKCRFFRDKTIEYGSKCLELDPKDGRGHYFLAIGLSWKLLNNNDSKPNDLIDSYTRCKDHLDQAIESFPLDPLIRTSRGFLVYKLSSSSWIEKILRFLAGKGKLNSVSLDEAINDLMIADIHSLGGNPSGSNQEICLCLAKIFLEGKKDSKSAKEWIKKGLEAQFCQSSKAKQQLIQLNQLI